MRCIMVHRNPLNVRGLMPRGSEGSAGNVIADFHKIVAVPCDVSEVLRVFGKSDWAENFVKSRPGVGSDEYCNVTFVAAGSVDELSFRIKLRS